MVKVDLLPNVVGLGCENPASPRSYFNTISAYAEKIVDDAHIIAKKSGGNMLDVLKAKVKDLKK